MRISIFALNAATNAETQQLDGHTDILRDHLAVGGRSCDTAPTAPAAPDTDADETALRTSLDSFATSAHI